MNVSTYIGRSETYLTDVNEEIINELNTEVFREGNTQKPELVSKRKNNKVICPENCQICTRASTCDSCFPGFVLENSQCVKYNFPIISEANSGIFSWNISKCFFIGF